MSLLLRGVVNIGQRLEKTGEKVSAFGTEMTQDLINSGAPYEAADLNQPNIVSLTGDALQRIGQRLVTLVFPDAKS